LALRKVPEVWVQFAVEVYPYNRILFGHKNE
jgi:hypothetical protein